MECAKVTFVERKKKKPRKKKIIYRSVAAGWSHGPEFYQHTMQHRTQGTQLPGPRLTCDAGRTLSQVAHLPSSREDQALLLSSLVGFSDPSRTCLLVPHLVSLPIHPPGLRPLCRALCCCPGPSGSLRALAWPLLCWVRRALPSQSGCRQSLPFTTQQSQAHQLQRTFLSIVPSPARPIFSRCLSHVHQGLSRWVLPIFANDIPIRS